MLSSRVPGVLSTPATAPTIVAVAGIGLPSNEPPLAATWTTGVALVMVMVVLATAVV